MIKRFSETEREQKYMFYTMNSPLTKTSSTTTKRVIPKKYSDQNKTKEFILDGVHEHMRKNNVVPSYNAFNDPHAQSYFRQPVIQDMLKRSATLDKGQLIPSATMPSYKLSVRKRLPSTPVQLDVTKRENRFIVDSIRCNSLKTSRNPVIPQYDALNDTHAKNYFRKKSVRLLLKQTCQVNI